MQPDQRFPPGAEASLIVLDADSRSGRAAVAMAIQARRPVVAVALDAGALGLLALAYPDAGLQRVVGSVVDERSAAWLAEDLRRLGLRFSGVLAPMHTADAAGDRPPLAKGLAVLYSRLG